jgi:hypothetical protein
MSPSDGVTVDRSKAAGGRLTFVGVLLVLLGLALQIGVFMIAAHSVPDASAEWLGGLVNADLATLRSAAQLNTQTTLLCLLVQAVAALATALGLATMMPARYRLPRIGMLASLWCLNFAVPIGGILCSLGALAVGAALPRPRAQLPVVLIEEPEFAANLIGTVSYGRGARLKAELQNAEAGTSFRMTALLAMQSMPARTVSPLLQGMLADPLDDIRLLAYGILDNREKVLTQQILVERPKLDRKLNPDLSDAERAHANRTLAQLYSELIYENLVTGDVYRNAADQADGFAAAALEHDPNDAALWRLRGRLAIARLDLDGAETMLQRAIDCGFPRDRMLPWLAETAYLRRDFARVRTLLGEIDSRASTPTLSAVLDFWKPRGPGAAQPRSI